MANLIAGQLGVFGFKPKVLSDVLAGKRVEIELAEGAFSRTFKGVQSPCDLETAFQLIHLLFKTKCVPACLPTCPPPTAFRRIHLLFECGLCHAGLPLSLPWLGQAEYFAGCSPPLSSAIALCPPPWLVSHLHLFSSFALHHPYPTRSPFLHQRPTPPLSCLCAASK